MKTGSTFIVTALLLCFFNAGMATGGIGFKAEVAGQNSFVLKLRNPGEEKIQVSFMDLNGVTLHEELYRESGVSQKFDLRNLPQGAYVLVVQHEDIIQIQPITKKEDVLQINGNNVQTILPPQIDQSSTFLDVKMDFPTDLSVYVQIEDNFGNVLYGGNVNSQEQLKRRYDLQHLASGDYHFSVFIEGALLYHHYTEDFKLIASR